MKAEMYDETSEMYTGISENTITDTSHTAAHASTYLRTSFSYHKAIAGMYVHTYINPTLVPTDFLWIQE